MAENKLLQFQSRSSKIDAIISRTDLLEKIREDYNLGNYETSITKAFKYLEESYISSNFDIKDTVTLSDNFDEDLLDIKTSSEIKAIRVKMLGAMHWINNMADASNGSREATAQVLAYVDLQLKLLDRLKN